MNNGYKCFYNGKQIEVYAATQLAARNEAAKLLKVPAKKHYMISAVLCELADSSQVIHSTASI